MVGGNGRRGKKADWKEELSQMERYYKAIVISEQRIGNYTNHTLRDGRSSIEYPQIDP